MAKKHVFISYAREDQPFAREVVRHLRQSDIPAWQDVDDLRGGDRWVERIDEALAGAHALIVIMSPDATQSQYVTYEWAFAVNAGVRVVPVLYKPTELHPRLAAFQFVNFAEVKGRRPWARLADALSAPPEPIRLTGAPRLRARFDMTNDKASRVKGREYVIWLWTENAPAAATSVAYEIHHEEFPEPRWTERNPHDQFLTWMQSYGDVPITATFRKGAKQLFPVSTQLFGALKFTHARSRNASIKRALEQIKNE